MPRKIEVEFIENFLVVWNPTEGSELYKMGFYGKPVGIPKPLAEKRIITVYEYPEKEKVTLRKLRQRTRQLYEEFDAKYTVYRDLRDNGLVVTPGIKFGCDFAVYKHGPGIEHAPYMVSVKRAKSEMTATEMTCNNRSKKIHHRSPKPRKGKNKIFKIQMVQSIK